MTRGLGYAAFGQVLNLKNGSILVNASIMLRCYLCFSSLSRYIDEEQGNFAIAGYH